MAVRGVELPDECWELIFKRLGHYQHLEAPSLVCKRFLAITNPLHVTLTVADPTILVLPRLLQRFQKLKKINLRDFQGDLNGIVCQIAQSALDLEELNLSNQINIPVHGLSEFGSKLKSLKILKCSRLGFLQDSDLIVIASSLPQLEEVDISYPEYDCGSLHDLRLLRSSGGIVTDTGIEVLSSKLRNLRKIDASGNQFISDRSLVSLSTNCILLTEIAVRDCCFISENGISFAMCQRPNLITISVNGIVIPSTTYPSSPSSSFKDSFIQAKALSALDFSHSAISDEFLYTIAEARLPLKKVTLSHCYSFTFSGIMSLLYAYQFLTCLGLIKVDFLTDQFMNELFKFLQNLTSINLSLCSKLTNSTFFGLIRNCPLLNDIEMERTNLGKEDFTVDFGINTKIRSLKLGRNMYLSNECIKKFGVICPGLQVLDVSHCSGVTEEGIGEVLKSCGETKHLEVNQCRGIKNLGMDLKLCKLEVLRARGSGINDEALLKIGKRCRGLLHLDLESCLNVTERGVKEVIANCKVLRDINLKWCDNVNVDIVAWMVFSRPSLRKIIPPCGFLPTESQKNLFLHHGCLVCKG